MTRHLYFMVNKGSVCKNFRLSHDGDNDNSSDNYFTI